MEISYPSRNWREGARCNRRSDQAFVIDAIVAQYVTTTAHLAIIVKSILIVSTIALNGQGIAVMRPKKHARDDSIFLLNSCRVKCSTKAGRDLIISSYQMGFAQTGAKYVATRAICSASPPPSAISATFFIPPFIPIPPWPPPISRLGSC
jgi:hypothetical protein